MYNITEKNFLTSCVSKDARRKNMAGIHHCGKKKLAVATDGYRMFCSKVNYNEKLAGTVQNLDFTQGSEKFPDYAEAFPMFGKRGTQEAASWVFYGDIPK